jgi:hypothetical protein
VNGVIQAPNTSYTISGSTIVFSTALSTTDTINFITVLGDVQNVGTPTAGTVTAASFATGFNGVVTWQNVQTTNFTAVAGRGYPVNTTSAGITVTLPSSAVAGNTIQIVDYAGTFGTNVAIINPNGLKLNGSTSSLQLQNNREGVQLVYIDSTQGWVAALDANSTTNLNPISYTASYLIVAGGGSAGYSNGGGGGAGGFLSSTTWLAVGTVYTITVGGGGTASSGSGTSGSNSSITGLTAAIGGGYGGYGTGSSGGSGGGGQNGSAGGSGTAGQGNAGGSASTSTVSPFNAAGGGGAGAAGGNANNSTVGAGGVGLTTSLITVAQSTTYSVGQVSGGSVYFSGGGGGASYATGGVGGIGGGGAGGGGNPSPGTAGTANTGGGGGGTGGNPNGSNGGSGVVILSVPTGNYSGTYTGSSTYVTTNGTSTVIIFKSSGTYTG